MTTYYDCWCLRLMAPNYCSPLLHRQCVSKKLSSKNRSSHMFFVCWGECHISAFSPYRIFCSIIVLFPFTLYPPFNLPTLSVYILSLTISFSVIPPSMQLISFNQNGGVMDASLGIWEGVCSDTYIEYSATRLLICGSLAHIWCMPVRGHNREAIWGWMWKITQTHEREERPRHKQSYIKYGGWLPSTSILCKCDGTWKSDLWKLTIDGFIWAPTSSCQGTYTSTQTGPQNIW